MTKAKNTTGIGNSAMWGSYGSDCVEMDVDGPEDKIRPLNGPEPTIEKGSLTLEQAEELLLKYTGGHGALVMLRGDGTYDYVPRPSQPCIGWMRVYGKGNLRDSYWPSDLRTAHRLFPDGLPVMINFTHGIPKTYKDFVEDTFLSPVNSPWRNAIFRKDGTSKFELIVGPEGTLRTIWRDLDIEATQLVSLLRSMRYYSSVQPKYDDLKKTYGKKIALIAACSACGIFGNAKADWGAIYDGNPKEWTVARFKDRGAYRRAVVEYPFGKDETTPQPTDKSAAGLAAFYSK